MKQRYTDLIDGYCSGNLSETEFEALEAVLRESREARRLLLEYRGLESALRSSASPGILSFVSSQKTHPVEPAKRRLRFEFYSMAAAIAVLLSGVAFLLLRGPDNTRSNSPSIDTGVAVLTRTIEADWDGRDLHPGDSLPPGRWWLASGSAELEFYSGASVILEGPVELEILSENGGILHHGKLRAHVPPHAHGFSISSADVELVDLGTTFAMETNEQSGTAVHVFEGKVELFDPRSDRSNRTSQELMAGEGLRLIRGQGSSHLTADPSEFPDPITLDRQARESLEFGYARWQNAMAEWSRDPRLVARYDFSPEDRQQRSLLNHSIQSSPGLNGSIVGARWSSGRWPEKNSLDFKRPSDRVRITVPGEYESLTLSAWVRVDGFDNPFNSLLLSDGWNRLGAIHWQILKDGYVELAVWNGPDNQGHNSRTRFIVEPTQFGSWMHLAVTYDGSQDTVSHYRNGKQLAVMPVNPAVPLRIADAQIGNWSPGPQSTKVIRNFNGRIDGLSIFSAALSEAEIAELYRVGKP